MSDIGKDYRYHGPLPEGREESQKYENCPSLLHSVSSSIPNVPLNVLTGDIQGNIAQLHNMASFHSLNSIGTVSNGVYLSPPVIPASLLYSSLYSSLPHSESFPSVHHQLQSYHGRTTTSLLPSNSKDNHKNIKCPTVSSDQRESESTPHSKHDPVWRPY